MNAPALSVIIVNWNVRELLLNCIRSLYSHIKLPRNEWELIVVDNNSQDGSADLVANEFPDATLIRSSVNTGFAGGNNIGFRASRGQWVLLLNPDTLVLDDAVDTMLDEISAMPRVGVLGCLLVNADGSFQRWTGGRIPNLRNIFCHFLLLYKILPHWLLPYPLYLEREPVRDIDVGWVSGACMMLRREALGANIFDERFFMYCEDLELCQRVARENWTVRFTVRARVLHLEGKSLDGQSDEIQVSKVRNLRRFFAMSHGALSLLAYDCIVCVGFAMRAAINTTADVLLPGRGFGGRARKSRMYAGEAFRGCFSGESREM